MNCKNKTCPWWSDDFSSGHCSHPTPDICKNKTKIEITIPTLNRLMDYYIDYCQDVYYSSCGETSLDVNDMNNAIETLLNDLDVFRAWMRGELT